MPPFNVTPRTDRQQVGRRADARHSEGERRDLVSHAEQQPATGRSERPGVRVLVAVDVTHSSAEKALRTGAWLAASSGGELLALNVVAPTDIWDAPAAATLEQSAAQLVERRRGQLEELVAGLDLPAPATALVEVAEKGDIAGTIAVVAVAHDAGVIVAATNQGFEWKGALLGSVTRRLVNMSSRPVLVVRH